MLYWKLQRSSHRNLKTKIRGIVITGKLSNRIVGKALVRGSNFILCSDQSIKPYHHEPHLELIEYLYKHDIFVVEWDINWLYRTKSGQSLLVKCYGAKTVWINESILELSYDEKRSINHIMMNFGSYLLYSKCTIDINDLSHERVQIIREFSEMIMLLKYEIIVSSRFPKNIETYLANNNIIIIIQETDFLNFVSRELYYNIKPGRDLPIEYEFNDVYKVRYVNQEKNGLDGI